MKRTKIKLRERDESIDNNLSPSDRTHQLARYRRGGLGFISWCEDNVLIPIYPEGSDIPVYYPMSDLPDIKNSDTGRSYKDMWEEQKVVLKRALRMRAGRFIHTLIVLCWPRGEGKSLVACLIQLWKFFCWPRQQIMLGANSRDQVKFVHYDIMRDLIRHSPKLLAIVGEKNIQEKEIRLKDERGNIRSIIRSISSFSGIVSNITGYTFSEIFDMKNPRFFVQLDGSIRNIPNALGVIDSTVSDKKHVLYSLYSSSIEKSIKSLFFSYRNSLTGDYQDYWNPLMKQAQLDDYRSKFPFGEFERYFQNLWSAGRTQVFSDPMIEEIGYMGASGSIMNHTEVLQLISEKDRQLLMMSKMMEKGFNDTVSEIEQKISVIETNFTPVQNYYSLDNNIGNPLICPFTTLAELGNLLDTDWCILAGADMGDPLAVHGLARTVTTVVAKGLPHSRSNPHLMTMEVAALKFVYFLLYIEVVENHSVGRIKEALTMAEDEYDGVDVMCGERYGLWDLKDWCEDRDMEFEPVFPSYDRQRESFNALYELTREGRFKSPPVGIPGSKKSDILREEMAVFDHDTDKRWFGSPEKGEKYGVQDDSIYSLGWTIYGGRNKGPTDFRVRKSLVNFGTMFTNKMGLLGKYTE